MNRLPTGILLILTTILLTVGCNSEPESTPVEPSASDPTKNVATSTGESAPKTAPAFEQTAPPITRPGETKWDEENAAEAPIPNGVPVCTSVMPKGGTRSNRMFVFQCDTADDKKKAMDF